MTLVLKALMFAKEKHSGQYRKASKEEYITHPVAVSYIVASVKRSKRLDELLAASILHDVLEDTNTTFLELAQEFTPLVAALVLELTNCNVSIKNMGKLSYHKCKLVGMSSYGLLIKLADRLHNISDNPSDSMIEDTVELIIHLENNRVLTKSHKELIKQIKELL